MWAHHKDIAHSPTLFFLLYLSCRFLLDYAPAAGVDAARWQLQPKGFAPSKTVTVGVLGLVMYVIWAGGIVWTIVRHLRGASLVLSLLLLCSLALFAVAYAMDYGLFSMKGTLWTIGQLCGSPMYILTDGIEKLTRMENGAAAILAAVAYLLPCIAGTAYAAGKEKK